MKTINFNTVIITGFVLFGLGYFIGNTLTIPSNITKDWTEVGGNIDIHYYLETSDDSIWIENYETKEVIGGKYADLEHMIYFDNM